MESYWWGLIILFILIVIVIIVIVYLNRGNALDVVNNLPSYNIFYPAGNKYLEMVNIYILLVGIPPFPMGRPVYTPVIGATDTPVNGLWSFESVIQSFDTLPKGSSLKKLINRVYFTADPTSLGYVNSFISTIPPATTTTNFLSPSSPVLFGTTFVFTPTADDINMFTLSTVPASTGPPVSNVIFNSNGLFSLSPTGTGSPAVLQLIPINTAATTTG